jgi:hypothetical protein
MSDDFLDTVCERNIRELFNPTTILRKPHPPTRDPRPPRFHKRKKSFVRRVLEEAQEGRAQLTCALVIGFIGGYFFSQVIDIWR